MTEPMTDLKIPDIQKRQTKLPPPDEVEKLLLEEAKRLFPNGFDVVYGDDDSIMVHPN